MERRILLFTCAALSAASLSCRMVESLHPLSDESNSVIDERLLGLWRGVPEENESPKDDEELLILIGEKEGRERTLECVLFFVSRTETRVDDRILESRTKKHISDRVELFARPVNHDTYLLSLETANTGYHFFRCSLPDDETLELRPLDVDVIRDAILSGRLKGTATGPPVPAPRPGERTTVASSDRIREFVRLTDRPQAMFKFLAENASAFEPYAGTFRKVNLRAAVLRFGATTSPSSDTRTAEIVVALIFGVFGGLLFGRWIGRRSIRSA